MKFTFDKIKEVSHGAVRAVENDGKVSLYRFTEKEQDYYKNAVNKTFYPKSFTPAGIRLMFKTNSSLLFIKINIPFVTTRSYFAVDVCVNGELMGSLTNYDGIDMSGDYTAVNYEVGTFEKRFELGDGIKNVCIFLPWSVPVEIAELSIDDKAFANALPTEKKILFYGDSITQGYDSLHPSKHYTAALSDFLNADVYNKAIGGEKFCPLLIDIAQESMPDYIFAAYGTNDWSNLETEVFKKSCRQFYEKLSSKYSKSKIFALSPIWRKDYKAEYKCGDFFTISRYIEEVTEKLQNVQFVEAFDFVPCEENTFADIYGVHPNEKGFEHFANNLYEAIKDFI